MRNIQDEFGNIHQRMTNPKVVRGLLILLFKAKYKAA